jgi:hypothetical protein
MSEDCGLRIADLEGAAPACSRKLSESAPDLGRDGARPSNSSIVDLRNLLAERFPHSLLPPGAPLRTGVPALDDVTEGGLPKSAITELISPHLSAGSAWLIYALLQKAYQDRYFLALIDACDSFDSAPLGNSRLRNLLWIRCHNAMEAVKSTDLLLRDGNFPLVILDLVFNSPEESRKIPQTSWYRLQRLVESVPTAFLVLTRRSMVSSAQWKLVLENRWGFPDLERHDTGSRLKICVQRSHLHTHEISRVYACS